MADAWLPPLAGLHMGTPTAMDAPPAQRPRPAPVAPSALANASGDAIALVITHAGMSARKSDNPPMEMCEWMKNFCRAGKFQAVAGCEDSWYFHALAAFGIDPMKGIGGVGALPSNSGFKSWRELFATLCECFYGSAAFMASGPVANSVALQMGTAPFWNFTKNVMGGGPVTRAFIMRFINPDANQRELDTLMNGLFEGWIAKEVLHRGQPAEIVALRSEKRTELHGMYEAWKRKEPSRLSIDTSPLMALVTLLDLRGAEPWQLAKYRGVDRLLYAAIHQVTQTENITPAIAAEQLERVRNALDRYADPNYDGSLEVRQYPLVTPRMPNPPPVLQQAVMASDGPILKLLLDRGAVLPDGAGAGGHVKRKLEFFDALLFATAFSMSQHWRVDRETTERLINMLTPFVRSLPVPGSMAGAWTQDRSYIDARVNRALADTNPAYAAMPQWLRDAWRSLIYVPPPPRRVFHEERA
jgi:hypothetical protein